MLNPSHPITSFLLEHDRTVADLAVEISYSATTIYRWIDGSRKPSAAALEALDRVSRGAIAPSDVIRFYRLHKQNNADASHAPRACSSDLQG